MAIDATHPLFTEHHEDQLLMRHSFQGERVIKAQGLKYLPETPGMRIDGMGLNEDGRAKYEAYKLRALFPDYVADAVEHLLGLMHAKPPVIELPPGMEPMLDKASQVGESLEALLRRINLEQLVTGRLGLLLDLPENPDPANPLPFIALYYCEALRNWDDSDDHNDVNSLSLVILDESGIERDEDFNWKNIERYRVLTLDPSTNKYTFGVYEKGATFSQATQTVPMLRGKPMDHIPFVFVNTKDLTAPPDNPPLLGLARLCMAIYRGDADYRQTLFLQGQDTLVVIGGLKGTDGDDTIRVGAGALVQTDIGGDAKYIGTSSSGLPELRMALENDHKLAETKTGQLIDGMGSSQESGEALKTRLAARTATLKQIAKTGAEALASVLRSAAIWMGADPEKVVVTPNLEFSDISIDAKTIVDLQTAKNMGAPLSNESIHEYMQDRKLTKKTYEEEMDAIENEAPIVGGAASNLEQQQAQAEAQAEAAAAALALKADGKDKVAE